MFSSGVNRFGRKSCLWLSKIFDSTLKHILLSLRSYSPMWIELIQQNQQHVLYQTNLANPNVASASFKPDVVYFVSVLPLHATQRFCMFCFVLFFCLFCFVLFCCSVLHVFCQSGPPQWVAAWFQVPLSRT